MDNYLLNHESYALWLLLSGTRAAISQARYRKVGKYIHHNQAAALVMIWQQEGKATPGSIARSLYLQHHSVSELLTRMENKGLIEKTRDESSRNIVRLSITPKGMDYCTQVTQADFIIGIMSSLTSEQRRQLRSLLQVLATAAQARMND